MNPILYLERVRSRVGFMNRLESRFALAMHAAEYPTLLTIELISEARHLHRQPRVPT